MFAIQQNSGKFVDVKYFVGPDVFMLSISATPHTYKTQNETQLHADRAAQYVANCITRLTNTEHSVEINKLQIRLNKVTEKLQANVTRPYNEVCKLIPKLERETKNIEESIQRRKTLASDDARALARWHKIYNNGFNVVRLAALQERG